VVLAVLIGASLWRKALRLNYEWWRVTHGLLAVAAVALALAHVVGVGRYLELPWKQALWITMSVALIAILFYVRVVKPFVMLRRPYAVQDVIPERGDSYTLVLRPDGHRRIEFLPGQFAWLTVRDSPFTIEEHPFSFSSSALDPDTLAVTIKELGDFTSTVKNIEPGTRAYLDGPYGAFSTDRHEGAGFVFIAGGIGITPFLPMMEALVRSSQRFDLHYAARTADRFLPVPEHPGRTCRYVNDGGRSSMDIGAILSPLSASVDLYVCGPRRLIEAVRTEAGVRGWPDKRVHFETFGTGFDPDDRPVKIHLAQSGSSIEVQPGTAILDALLEAGVWAPYECRRGQCASCMTEVLSGTPEHRDLCLTEQQRRRAMCTCVSWSRTAEIVLNL
jgi:predicted ferric reductase/ferredoxin